ncbi:EAL domain-containing protein [Francisella sp. 19X1-34]|uniref:putative bifunctional diguanylate cyclase/phosphodiesterase n=1 Tax=Francisella sp. 19X1-34 TaxID=3087177 RepID=UPI002E308802|nr:EAL domain-containing protein [Francisella sp. 19X1-34]MED7789659.1 EAL domain-containing protein [Francisella sp. 19X1-34]
MGKLFSYEARIYTKNDQYNYIKVVAEFYLGSSDHRPNRLTGICLDITPIKQAEFKLDKMARYDVMTGIANREFFLTQLNKAITRAKRSKNQLALFFLDLDNFKQINDTYGHAYGDILLQEIVLRLKEVLRQEDFIGRIGGDEFAIVIEDVSSLEEVRSIASRALEVINYPFDIKNNEIHQSFSLGISIYPDTALNVDDLLQFADTAMYRAKEKGKNNFVFFQDDLDKKMQRNNKIEYALRRPVGENNFSLLYQPQYDNQQNITGIEALIRWQHPEIHDLTPDEFIPIAEKTRRIVDIGYWVLDKSIQDFLSLPYDLRESITLSINFSGIQLVDPCILTKTKQILDKHSIQADKLIFEVTETHLMNQIDKAAININKLNELGIVFSLDDFGTGYSSLNYLAKLPIDYLKIDKEFVAQIDDESNQTIIKTMISLGKSLGMSVVAEGVEKLSQLQYLASIDCDKYQGYYFSKPMTIAHILDHWKQKKT